MRFGYKFIVYRGYTFDQGDIFSGYVNALYSLRKQYPKNHPMNMIAKLLLNSLYGKFGQRLEMKRVERFDCRTDDGRAHFITMLELYGESVHDFVQVGDNYLIIRDTYANISFLLS